MKQMKKRIKIDENEKDISRWFGDIKVIDNEPVIEITQRGIEGCRKIIETVMPDEKLNDEECVGIVISALHRGGAINLDKNKYNRKADQTIP